MYIIDNFDVHYTIFGLFPSSPPPHPPTLCHKSPTTLRPPRPLLCAQQTAQTMVTFLIWSAPPHTMLQYYTRPGPSFYNTHIMGMFCVCVCVCVCVCACVVNVLCTCVCVCVCVCVCCARVCVVCEYVCAYMYMCVYIHVYNSVYCANVYTQNVHYMGGWGESPQFLAFDKHPSGGHLLKISCTMYTLIWWRFQFQTSCIKFLI